MGALVGGRVMMSLDHSAKKAHAGGCFGVGITGGVYVRFRHPARTCPSSTSLRGTRSKGPARDRMSGRGSQWLVWLYAAKSSVLFIVEFLLYAD